MIPTEAMEIYHPGEWGLYAVRWSTTHDGYSVVAHAWSVCDGKDQVMTEEGIQPARRADSADFEVEAHFKWDGCVNWSVQNGPGGAHHTCGAEGVSEFADFLKWLYVRAGAFIPEAIEECRRSTRQDAIAAGQQARPL